MRRNLQREHVRRVAHRAHAADGGDARRCARAACARTRRRCAASSRRRRRGRACRRKRGAPRGKPQHARRSAEGAVMRAGVYVPRRRPRRRWRTAPTTGEARSTLRRSDNARAREPRAGRSTRTCARSRRRSTSTIARRGERFSITGGRRRAAGREALERFYDARPRSRSRWRTSSWAWSRSRTSGAARRRHQGHDAPALHAPRRPARRARRARSQYLQADAQPRHHVRHRPRGNRQDVSSPWPRGRCARARHGEAHRAHAPRGRGGRAAGLPAGRPRAEGRSVPAPALRRALRPHGLRQGARSSSSAARSRSRRSRTCAGARSTTRS